MKRNDVVYAKNDQWCMLGRINRILPDGKAEVIDCGRSVRIYNTNDLEVTTYRGRFDRTRHGLVFRPMPTLRQLKQNVSHHDKTIWKKHRKGRFADCTKWV